MKVQKNIDSFFINKSPNKESEYSLNKYFYLHWSDKIRPDKEAYWTNTRPEKINFIEKIDCNYIKKGFYFYICGYFIDNDEKFILRPNQIYNNVHFLKSHLQKSIRKQNGNLAVQTCFHLMKLDLIELLRRLPIIMLEDVILHKSISTIIWLMVANGVKIFKMKNYIYEWILGFVYVLAMLEKKDFGKIIEEEEDNNKNDCLLNSYNKLDNNNMSILYSLHIRIAYGGISGDMKMINNFINIWYNRFRDNKNQIFMIESIIKPISLLIKEMNLEDWDLSAIDYHCHPKFIELISKKYDDIPQNELRKLVWNNSSSINYRIKNKEYNIEKWNKIKEYVIKTQKYLLDSSY